MGEKPKIIGLFELTVWIGALIYLALLNPYEIHHFSLCPLKNFGFDFCPGCGLGLSISYLFHFEFVKSFQTHLIGSFALVIIIYRIFCLIKFNIKTIKVFKNKENT